MGLLQVAQQLGGILGLPNQQQPPTPYPPQGGISVQDGQGASISPYANGLLAQGAGVQGADPSQMGGILGNGSAPSMPTPGAPNATLGAIDKLLFGGAFGAAQNDALSRRMAQYQAQQLGAYGQSLPPDQQRAFYADPQGYIKTQETIAEKKGTPVDLAGGHSLATFGDGVGTTAPFQLTDEKSGTTGWTTPQGGFVPQGQFGGDITTKDGLITSGRTGVVGAYSTPQKLAPGEAPGTFTPAVSGMTPGFTPTGSAPALAPSPMQAPNPRSLQAMQADPQGFFSTILGAPVTVTSGMRSVTHNAAVGGSPTSEHLTGTAWDLVPPRGVSNAQLVGQLRASGVPFDQIIDEGSHVHFGIGPKMRGQVLQSDRSGGYRNVGSAPQANAQPAASGWSVGAPVSSTRNASPAELAAAGYAPGTVGQVLPTGELKVTQTPQTAGNYSDQDKARMASISGEAEAANQYASQAHQFVASAGKSANPIYNIPGADHIGAVLNPNLRALENLGTQMATTLRAPGMRMTQMEFKKFGEVSPSIENTTEANAQIASQAAQLAGWKQQKATFYQDWIGKNGNLNGADQAWDQHEAQALGGQSQPSGGNAPQQPQPSQRLTPQQAQMLPPGTPFITLDGRSMVRH